ncbi:subclass B1 metallo-beta-lactamase [Lysinibacillus sp. NPDC093197]|uniref:subclass B1 metallo-beta-lactamase n=1 Tax=Lysinibacillus sp. NPDC093197 TaxID=3364132 RepID=UPI00382C484E
MKKKIMSSKKVLLCVLSLAVIIGSFLFPIEKSKTYASTKSEENEGILKGRNQTEISNKDGSVKLTKINNEVWVHTTYENMDGYLVPANGLLINSSKGLYLIDATWNDQLADELLTLIEQNFHKRVKKAIITHHKIDRVGGIQALLDAKIPVESTSFIAKMIKDVGYPQIKTNLDRNPVFKAGKVIIETYYPGEAHTRDNIVVWLPQYKMLFGDMIFALEQDNVGIIDEANMSAWPHTMQNLINKYPEAKVVIPGHKNWGDFSLLSHTIENLKNYELANK